ncbi:MAG: pyridoxal-phosphate dependent enzyme [Armatimonadota bacterium]
MQPYYRGCPSCRAAGRIGPLFLTYETTDVLAAWEQERDADRGMWAYAAVLPLPADARPVSLGEGNTPLLRLSQLGASSNVVYLKLELRNPTGSYKDRLNSVAVSMAIHHGAQGIACSSTGNHGVSLAAYARAGGLRSIVLLPEEAPPRAISEIRQFGGVALVMPWDDREQWLDWLVEEAGWAVSARNFPRTLGNPYGIEGYKTIAYEVVRQLDGRPPATVFMPTGGGDGIYGLWRGFKELHGAGIIDRLPRLVACQPERSASVYRAFAFGAEHVAPVDLTISCALSLTDRQGGDHALWAVRESSGWVAALSEDDILAAVRVLGDAGLNVEPAGAASLAGFLRAGAAVGAAEEPAVCVLTGSGDRWPVTASTLQPVGDVMMDG